MYFQWLRTTWFRANMNSWKSRNSLRPVYLAIRTEYIHLRIVIMFVNTNLFIILNSVGSAVHIGLDRHEAIAGKGGRLLQYRSVAEQSKQTNFVAFVRTTRRTGDNP
jgi:hypothetical protein